MWLPLETATSLTGEDGSDDHENPGVGDDDDDFETRRGRGCRRCR